MKPEHVSGGAIQTHQRYSELMEEIVLAEKLGLDVYAIGEHHRPDFVVSSPSTVLAAAAAVTKKIRLSSAVTVLSSEDPVRVFQQYATVDQLSGGRAEIMAGRGSFIESFPLFGYDLDDYDELFTEKLDLLLKLNETEKISWSGKHRAPISNLGVYPRPLQQKLPVWIAVGGTPESVIRAARLKLPLAIAIIGGTPDRFAPFAKLYRDHWEKSGHDPKEVQLSINSHGYIAEDGEQAREEYWPSFSAAMNKLGKERGWSGIDREQYEFMCSDAGALFVGSPQEIIDKILYEYRLFSHSRFLLQMSVGTMPHEKNMRSIELFGSVVAPAVRKALGR
jgi:probable LLM family oxidoreductase